MAISAVSPINTSASLEISEGKNILDLETEVKKILKHPLIIVDPENWTIG